MVKSDKTRSLLLDPSERDNGKPPAPQSLKNHERLAAALRENLKKRKAQSRARAQSSKKER